jgi:hypothetical protein
LNQARGIPLTTTLPLPKLGEAISEKNRERKIKIFVINAEDGSFLWGVLHRFRLSAPGATPSKAATSQCQPSEHLGLCS